MPIPPPLPHISLVAPCYRNCRAQQWELLVLTGMTLPRCLPQPNLICIPRLVHECLPFPHTPRALGVKTEFHNVQVYPRPGKKKKRLLSIYTRNGVAFLKKTNCHCSTTQIPGERKGQDCYHHTCKGRGKTKTAGRGLSLNVESFRRLGGICLGVYGEGEGFARCATFPAILLRELAEGLR